MARFLENPVDRPIPQYGARFLVSACIAFRHIGFGRSDSRGWIDMSGVRRHCERHRGDCCHGKNFDGWHLASWALAGYSRSQPRACADRRYQAHADVIVYPSLACDARRVLIWLIAVLPRRQFLGEALKLQPGSTQCSQPTAPTLSGINDRKRASAAAESISDVHDMDPAFASLTPQPN